MAWTWNVAIDWDNDGSFATAGDDITSEVKAVKIKVGGPGGDAVARVGSCELTLRNVDKRFSPLFAASTYFGRMLPNRPVRVQVTSGATYTLFRGFVKAITPQPDKYGERTAIIRCEDYLGLLQAATIEIPLLESVRSDVLLTHVVNYALSAAAATNRADFSAAPANLDTLTPNGTAYRFVTALALANDVLIGAGYTTTIDNLRAAINSEAGAGTRYHVSSVRPAFVTAALNASYHSLMRTSEPVRWYRLNETSGTVAADSGGNGIAGTYVGSPTLNVTSLISGDTGDKAVTFDGVNDVVTLGQLNIAAASFSVSAWINASAAPPATQDAISAFVAASDRNQFSIRIYSDGRLEANYFTSVITAGAGTIVFGTSYQIDFVYDSIANTGTLYRNGASVASGAGFAFLGANAAWQIGATNGAQWFKGTIDEAAIWFRALTASEISARYAARTLAPGVTLAYTLRGAVGNAATLTKSSAAITLAGATFSGGVDQPAGLINFQTGDVTFDIAADTWKQESTNGYSAISDVAQSERGRFFAQRDGTLTYWYRDNVFVLAGTAPVMTVSTETTGVNGQMESQQIYNSIKVNFIPRNSTGTGVVARSSNAITVPGKWGTANSNPNQVINPAGGELVVNLAFTDTATGRAMGAKALTLPLAPTTDYTVDDGAGTDYTSQPFLTISAAIKASGVALYFRNTALGPLFVRNLQVRGTKIVRYEQQSLVAEDAASIAAYGKRVLSVDLPLATDANYARSLASYLLGRYKDPAFRLSRVEFPTSRDVWGGVSVFAPQLGDTILLTEAQTAVTGQKYLISGAEYDLDVEKKLKVAFELERLDDTTYWILDNATYSLLGTTTRLGV